MRNSDIDQIQAELFSESPSRSAFAQKGTPIESDIASMLNELSADAYNAFIHAWMSELPIEKEIISFGRKVICAAQRSAIDAGAIVKNSTGESRQDEHLLPGDWMGLPEARLGAEKVCTDRGDPDVYTVQKAAYKVVREIDRLMGLLRFNPNAEGWYIARCSPDTFVLPCLAGHFSLRFGETPWAIIDEKRNIALVNKDGSPQLISITPQILNSSLQLPNSKPKFPNSTLQISNSDPWESLWQQYHQAINNEGRKNPGLQRQFMPKRYWKYLPEMK
jgi:hypothetical protein